ncbi:hypothetical protein SBRCBS47491_005668 [Sporothrix bragantina]|uniref:C6 zinc finger domain containing protein n=1 Tax=Sporothrix bragantina TaxID=671064 RepID=A0ABP0BYM2_9PEZI
MSNNGINNNNDYLDCPPLFGNNAVPNVSPQLGPLFAPGLGMAGTSHIGAGGADAEFQGAGTGANGFAPMPQAREIGFPAGLVAPGPSVFSGFNNVHMNPVPLASQSAFAQGLPQTLQNGLHHGLQYGPQQMPFNPAFQQPLLQGVQQGQAMQPSHNQSQLFCFPPNSFLFHPNSQVPQGFAMPPNQGAVPIPGDSQFGQAYTGMLMQPCIQPYGGNHVPVLEMNHPRQIVNPNNEGFMFPIKTSGPVMDPAISDTLNDSQQELQPAFNYSQPLARNSRPQLQSAVTVTSETSFGLDSSSPLSSISATQGNSSYKKVNSAPPSAFGESTMRVPKVPTVPGSMLNQFAADMSHQSTNSEGNRNTKRRHSDDVDATTAALAKKAPRGGKKENGKRLRPELKARAKDIIASGQEMSIDKPGMLLVFQVLSEYKTARPNFYQPFHEVNAKSNKFFATPFYQASIMLQAHDFLDAYAKEPHLTHLGPESEDVLRLWRAVSAARALKFITAMMDKNRMPNETPPNSDHAKFLVVNLATIFEQTEAYDKTLAAGTRMSEPLKEQQRQLNYQLAYRLRKMSDYAFGPDSGLAKNVHISKESASLDKAFWSQLGALWPHPVNEGAGDRVMTSSAHTTPATLVSATTSIDMNFATTPVAAQGFFSAPQISASLMPPATVMQRRESRASLTKKKSSQKPKKERERKEDDKWDDERDAADTNTIIAVRSPIRDGEPDKDLVDMIKAIEVLQIGEAISGPALDIDDGTMFLAGRLDGTAWTPDAGSPSDLFGNIYTADDDHITNNVDRSHGGVQIENEDGSITVPTVLSGSVDAPDLTNDVDSRDFDPGLDRVDSMALDAFMADSLKQAQAQDDANPNFDYGAMSSVPSSSELKVPNSNPHLMAGPTSAPNTSRPTTAASAASANSDNGLTAGRARACGSPSRSRSVRYLGKGKEAVRNMFRARNP